MQATNPTLTLRPVAEAELTAARGLFKAYPYKTLQQRIQGLDRARLVEFYGAGLDQAVAAGHPHWMAFDRTGPVALAGLVPDSWHSGIYGLRMGKVQPWLNTRQPAVAGPLMLEQVERAAREAGMQHLSLRIDGSDFDNLRLFEASGWRTVDVSLKFTRALPSPGAKPEAPALADVANLHIATHQPEDAEWIRHLGSTTHGGTHFLNDPALPADLTRVLFAKWIDRCLERLAWRIYTLKDGADRGLGFVTYLTSEGFARALGRRPLVLDFVLLAPEMRGAGRGAWFIEQTLADVAAGEKFDFCELRTSAHNLPAVACYEKLGFRLCSVDFTLHKSIE